MERRVAAATVILGAAVSYLLSGSPAQAQPYHYDYRGQPQHLFIDTAQIAFFGGASAAHDLASLGIAPRSLHTSPFPGMSTADAPASLRSGNGIKSLVAAVSSKESVEFASPVFLDSRGDPVVIMPYLHVGFRDGVDQARADAVLAAGRAGEVEARDWSGLPGVYRVRARSKNGIDVLATANALAKHPDVRFAEPDMIVTGHMADLLPNDPGFPLCWGLHNVGQGNGTDDMDMDAPGAWDITVGDPSILVAILDTGVQQDHPDINQLPGIDMTGSGVGGGPVNECDNHGTSVAGCVSARINNATGTVGVAPGVKSVSVRWGISNVPCDGSFTAAHSWLVQALNWAQLSGVRVTNSSFTLGVSSAVADKFDQTREAGLLHVAAAGNNGTDELGFPASLASVLAVAALDRNGNRTAFSQFGSGLSLMAPGDAIYTTDRTGADGYDASDFVSRNGTSFAAPYVAGVAGLVLSMNPSLSPTQVQGVLSSTATDFGAAGYDIEFGWGFVNAQKAVGFVAPFMISFEPAVPSLILPDTSNIFALRVTENIGSPITGSGALHYSLNGAPFETKPIEHITGSEYETQLPAMPCGGVLDFYVTFKSSFGFDVRLPAGAPNRVFTAPVATGTAIVLSDDFESDLGWTVVNSPELTDGAWDRGIPAGAGDRGDPTLDYDGSGYCFLTDNVAGNSDVDAGSTTLVSPAVDLSAAPSAKLTYARWLSNNSGPNPDDDPLVVELSANGIDWVVVEETATSSRWVERTFNVSQYVPLSDTVQVRFTVSDYAPWGSYVEAAVDAVSFTSLGCEEIGCVESLRPLADVPTIKKDRFLSFAGANPGRQTAVRVRFSDLPPPYDVLDGQTMWVGQPMEVSENGGAVDPLPGFATTFVAPLQCDPFYTDWNVYPSVNVFDERIVPSGVYAVQEIDLSCDLGINAGFSDGLVVETGVWGDLVGPFDAAQNVWTSPDGRVDVASDVVAQLDGFSGGVDAIAKTRLDVEPEVPDLLINITDVAIVLDAFEGIAYPFPPVAHACP